MRSVNVWRVALAWACFSATQAASEEQFFDSDGVRIHYTVEGTGEPVILIHGFTASADLNWRLPGVLSVLAKDYRVIALDVRGHGRSDKPHDAAQYGVKMGEDVLRLLDRLQVPRAHVVGYSMGGFITLKLMTTHPERFLTATLAGSGGVRERFWCDAWCREFPKGIEQGLSLAEAVVAAAGVSEGRPLTDAEKLILKMLPSTNDSRAMGAVVQSWAQLKVEDRELKANRIPTLVLYGSEEFPKARPQIEELKSVLPQSELRMIKGANHLTTPFHKDFVEALQQFLGRHRQAAR